MNHKSELVNQYSIAFIEATEETSKINLEVLFNDLVALKKAIDDNKKYLLLLNSSNLNIIQKQKIINELLGKDSETFIRNMIYYMLDKDDQKFLLDVLQDIIEKLSFKLNILLLKITSAYELSSQDVNRIVEKVGTKLKKKIFPEVIIDKSYIAGISIEYHSSRIDNSIKTKLNEIRNSLLK